MSDRKGRQQGRPCPHSLGFTIVEFAVTLVIVAISLSIAIPALQRFSVNNQVISANNTIVTGLNMARSTAITTGDDITICPTLNGTTCAEDNWDNGWIIFNDEDNDGAVDSNEIVRVVSIESNLDNSGFGESIVFQSDGTTDMNSNATITNCHSDSNYSDSCMEVLINQFGVIESYSPVYGEGEES